MFSNGRHRWGWEMTPDGRIVDASFPMFLVCAAALVFVLGWAVIAVALMHKYFGNVGDAACVIVVGGGCFTWVWVSRYLARRQWRIEAVKAQINQAR